MIELSEHRNYEIKCDPKIEESNFEKGIFSLADFELLEEATSKLFPYEEDRSCFTIETSKKEKLIDGYQINADYYVGLDWLVEDKISLYIEPKMNLAFASYFEKVAEEAEENGEKIPNKKIDEGHLKVGQIKEIDYLKMLLQVLSVEHSAKAAKKLVYIGWKAPMIPIKTAKYDRLTPFLIVQFLRLLKTIVRKGLKKSYYKIQKNLNNRLKGKILVGAHIKKNVFKNRLTTTYCEYEEFGADSVENRFLKKVMQFCASFIENHKGLFEDNLADVQQLIRYCQSSFQKIGNHIEPYDLKNIHFNPFFREYEEALEVGQYILKRFSYNLTKTVENKTEIPPFWIDMPQLFELYFYSKLLIANPGSQKNIHFQFSTYGNVLDLLISKDECEMIIDTKYKPYYNKGRIHEDIRQVSGYARLNKVRNELKVEDSDKIIDCLIIYPKMGEGIAEETFELSKLKEAMTKKSQIKMYHKVYKLGIDLPLINSTGKEKKLMEFE